LKVGPENLKNRTMKELLEKIQLWWKFEGKYYHRDFIIGIKNLWNWFPVIWKDRDWDQTFIYEVLIHKLEKQAKYIGEREFHTRAQRDAELMLLCARLARIQQEDLYSHEYFEYLDQDFEFIPTDETEKYFTMESTVTRDDLIDYFYKYRRQHKLIDKTDKDNHRIAMEIAVNNQERSRKLLFKIMEENIDGWWD
jgi:hypothetical protein